MQEPGGCFEQTSSTNYPNVMVLQLPQDARRRRSGAGRASRTAARQRLQAARPATRASTKGYEWFGGDPGPRGADRLRPARSSRTWRRSTRRRRGDGRAHRARGCGRAATARAAISATPRRSTRFGRATAEVTDAYITYALAEAGEQRPRRPSSPRSARPRSRPRTRTCSRWPPTRCLAASPADADGSGAGELAELQAQGRQVRPARRSRSPRRGGEALDDRDHRARHARADEVAARRIAGAIDRGARVDARAARPGRRVRLDPGDDARAQGADHPYAAARRDARPARRSRSWSTATRSARSRSTAATSRDRPARPRPNLARRQERRSSSRATAVPGSTTASARAGTTRAPTSSPAAAVAADRDARPQEGPGRRGRAADRRRSRT